MFEIKACCTTLKDLQRLSIISKLIFLLIDELIIYLIKSFFFW